MICCIFFGLCLIINIPLYGTIQRITPYLVQMRRYSSRNTKRQQEEIDTNKLYTKYQKAKQELMKISIDLHEKEQAYTATLEAFKRASTRSVQAEQAFKKTAWNRNGKFAHQSDDGDSK